MNKFILEDAKQSYEERVHKFFIFHSTNFASTGKLGLSAIDEILWLLRDGEWHDLKKITEGCSSPESKVKMAISFLREYDFIQVNEKGRRAKLRPLMLKFTNEIKRVEKEALSHEALEDTVGIQEFKPLRRSLKKP